MPGDLPRRDENDSLERRELLRKSASVGVGTLGFGVMAMGEARAQNEGDTVTVAGAIPADTATLGKMNYSGLFLHVGGVYQEAGIQNLNCAFVEDMDAIVTYEVSLIRHENGQTLEAQTLLFTDVKTNVVEHGNLFIITDQQRCSDDRTQIRLAKVGQSMVDTAEVGVQDDAEITPTGLPGFGIGVTVAGLLGAGELLRRQRESDD